jgi:hypothetical protein
VNTNVYRELGRRELANARVDCMRKLRESMLNKETCMSVMLIGAGEGVIGMM